MLRRLVPSGRRPPAAVLKVVLLTTFLLTLAACRPPSDRVGTGGSAGGASSSGLSIAIEARSATTIGEVPLSVTVLDAGEPLSGAAVRIVGDMTHAGMQPVLRDALETSAGEYRADDFTFTMAGDWIITATVTTSDGRRANTELFLNVPAR